MDYQDRWREEMDYWIHMSHVINKELEQILQGVLHKGNDEVYGEVRYWMKDYVEMVVLQQILFELMEQPHNEFVD